MSKISGLGLEHEIVMYTNRKIYSGRTIKSRYVIPSSGTGKKRERRNIQATLDLIRDNYDYLVDVRLNSSDYNRYIDTLHLYIIPRLLGKKVVFPQELINTGKMKMGDWIRVQELGRILEPIIGEKIEKDPTVRDTVLNFEKGLDIDWNNIGRYSEFITQNPFNRNIGEVVDELLRMEKLFLEIVRETDFENAFYPTISTSQFVEFSDKNQPNRISSDYNGSFHLNITLPYPRNISYKDFAYRHYYAMLTLQWLEPLMLSLWGQPDAYAYGDDGIFVQGSYRMMVNSFSGIGTVKLDLDNIKSVAQLVSAFDSISDRMPPVERRNFRPGIDLDTSLRRGYPNPIPDTNIYTPGIGADFRRGDLDKKQVPRDHKYFGFEFRILDNIPTVLIADVLRIIYLLCDHSFTLYKKGFDLQNPTHNASWNSILVKIFHHGHNAILTEFEINDLLSHLAIDFPDIKNFVLGFREASLVFKAILSILYKTYGKLDKKQPVGYYSKDVAKDKQGNYYTEPPALPNLNRRAFNSIIETFGINPKNGQARGFLEYVISLLTEDETDFDTIYYQVAKEYPEYLPELINTLEYLQSRDEIKIKRDQGNIVSVTVI